MKKRICAIPDSSTTVPLNAKKPLTALNSRKRMIHPVIFLQVMGR
ncbi:MAG TPA: hypothetical protein PLE24_08040 [Chitinispirillaceae bacterium]|nr:hypothetical protein [Chitinispirillaceae bacterium]